MNLHVHVCILKKIFKNKFNFTKTFIAKKEKREKKSFQSFPLAACSILKHEIKCIWNNNHYRLDPTKFSEGLRILIKNGATSEEIEAFKQRCEEADVSQGKTGTTPPYQIIHINSVILVFKRHLLVLEKIMLRIGKWLDLLQRAEKEKNMQATPVSDEDFGTSIKSGIDALGSGNPMTIQTSGQLPGTITVQGGQCSMNGKKLQ